MLIKFKKFWHPILWCKTSKASVTHKYAPPLPRYGRHGEDGGHDGEVGHEGGQAAERSPEYPVPEIGEIY